MEYVFATKLSKKECIQRLKTNTSSSFDNLIGLATLGSVFSGKKHTFDFDGQNITLERIRNRNLYSPFFVGKLSLVNNSTKLEGEIKTAWWAVPFTVIWFSFVGIVAIFMIAHVPNTVVNDDMGIQEAFLSTFGPIVLFFGGFVIFQQMKIQAERWKIEMVGFIETTLNAKQI